VQLVVPGAKPSAGQAPEVPVQLSAASHTPSAGRQTVLEDLKTSTHVLLVPLQWSASSQAPPWEAPVQLVVGGAKALAGHVVLDPVHISAASQAPADGRQTAPALPAACWQAVLVPSHLSVVQMLPSSVHGVPASLTSMGQAGLKPVHTSATSHSPAAARQDVPVGWNRSIGQSFVVPSHVSATSQFAAAERHTVVEDATASGQAALLPVHVSATSQSPLAARQTVVFGLNPRSTQVPAPSQVSWFSHAPEVAPHAKPLGLNVPQTPLLHTLPVVHAF
jgi:hypothetical protein